jgi:hypothetical protein
MSRHIAHPVDGRAAESLLQLVKPRSTEERDFEAWQQERWDAGGWCCYHVDDSRRIGKGRKGWPDRVAVHPRTLRLVVAENKARESVRPEQWVWLRLWMAVGAEVYVWRPEDKADIELILDPEFDPLNLAVVQKMRCWKEAEFGRKPRRGE